MGKLYKAVVMRNTQLSSGIFNLVMVQSELAALAQPGQFLNIRVSGTTSPLLRRPISIHWVDGEQVEILFQVVGKGTEILAGARPGDLLDVQGPLGRGFTLLEEGRVVLVGGGMGIAPLGYLAQRLEGQPAIGLLGARNAQILAAVGGSKLADLGLTLRYATDDGSKGIKGVVTELLAQELSPEIRIYACGPKVMLREVSRLALEHDIPCQISLEEHMGCGVGACLGCVCQGVPIFGKDTYRRVCSDGPVFEAREVIWQ